MSELKAHYMERQHRIRYKFSVLEVLAFVNCSALLLAILRNAMKCHVTRPSTEELLNT
jgi:hypothetical protein